jgi:hypothetical protein
MSTFSIGMSISRNPITYDELPPEHKQKFDSIKAQFKADLIGSFERTRNHDIRWKGFSSEGALDGVDLSTPSEERLGPYAKNSTTWWPTLCIGTLKPWSTLSSVLPLAWSKSS